MRFLLIYFTILAPISAWTALLPSERSESGWGVPGCGETNLNDYIAPSWSVRVLNLDTQLECGGAFVTRKHIITSPSCLLVNGEPVEDVSSQIIVVHVEMHEPAQHYRFPSSFLDDKFHGAEIAIVEVKEGLQRHYPVCITHPNVRVPRLLRTVTPKHDIVRITSDNPFTLTNCMKTEGPRNIFENCTIIIGASSSTSFTSAPGDPIFYQDYAAGRWSEFLLGVRRAAKNSDTETIDGEVDGMTMGVSIDSWGQFVCEHTGVCNPDDYFHLNDRFRKYIEDGKGINPPIVTCTSKVFDDVKSRFSALPRITKTEAEDIRRNCGREKKLGGIFRKNLYAARIFMGDLCIKPYCDSLRKYEPKKVCDGVFIAERHILASFNCFRTLNFKRTDLYVLGYHYYETTIERAVGPICHDESCTTTNDFVILIVKRPRYYQGVICLPTRAMALELEKKDVKLAKIDLDDEYLIVEEQIDVKLNRVNCTRTKSCSYFNVEIAKDRSELIDGAPIVYTEDIDGSEVIFLAGLLNGRKYAKDNRKRATDMLHLLDRICLLTGICMEEFDTLKDIAGQEIFDTSERSTGSGIFPFQFYQKVDYNSQGATNELFAQLSGDPPKGYLPEISRLAQEQNEELQHICGKATPSPVINYGVNMSTSQFVVGIGSFLAYPMDFGMGPTCSGVIISQRHVLTADHCVDRFLHTPSRVYVMYGANCFNPMFSRHNHTTYNTPRMVPCKNSGQRTAYVKHIIYAKHQLWRSSRQRPTQFRDAYHNKYRGYAVGDFAILVLREDLVFDSTTSPICMPKHEQTYKQEILYAYGVGGATNYTVREALKQKSDVGIVTRAMFNNHSKALGRPETRIGRDEDYWVEIDNYKEGLPALDQGDSGGPWMRTSKDDRSVLVSVTSQGRGRYKEYKKLPFMSEWGPNLEREGDFICKWTGICPMGIDGSRDKQATEIDGVEYCADVPAA